MIYLALASFIGTWIYCTFIAFKRGFSKVIGIGGGFIAGAIAFAVVAGVGTWKQQPPLPESIDQAGLAGKRWNSEEMNLAARITMKNLRDIQTLVEAADKRGDSAVAMQSIYFLTPLIRAWNDQDGDKLGGYRNCVLAAVHLVDGGTVVSRGGNFEPDRFESALSACNQSIH